MWEYLNSYVPEQSIRLQLYRRLANLQGADELKLLISEFEDRFGPLPEDTENLLLPAVHSPTRRGIRFVECNRRSLINWFYGFPPLPEGVQSRNLPQIHPNVRIRKKCLLDADEW